MTLFLGIPGLSLSPSTATGATLTTAAVIAGDPTGEGNSLTLSTAPVWADADSSSYIMTWLNPATGLWEDAGVVDTMPYTVAAGENIGYYRLKCSGVKGAVTTIRYSNVLAGVQLPVATAAPSISNTTPDVGDTVTVTEGTYTNSPTITGVLTLDGVDVSGDMSGLDYTIPGGASDLDTLLWTETATNDAGSAADQTATATVTFSYSAPTFNVTDQNVVTGVGPFTLDVSTYMTDDGRNASVSYSLTAQSGVSLAGSTLTFTDTVGTYSVEVTAIGSDFGSTVDTFDFTIAEVMEATGTTDASVTETGSNPTIPIFEDLTDPEDPIYGFVRGGANPVATKTGGDSRLTITDGNIVVDDSAGGFVEEISFSVADDASQSIADVTVTVTVNESLVVSVDEEFNDIVAVGTETVELTIAAGLPHAGTYTLDPTLVIGAAPRLAVGTAPNPYISGGTLYTGVWYDDTAVTLTIAWYNGSNVLISGETGTVVPGDAAYATVTASDGTYTSTTYKAYVPGYALSANTPQTWASDTAEDPATFGAATYFSGGVGAKSYAEISDATGVVSINTATGNMTITGGATSGAVVIRCTDGPGQTADLTVNVDRAVSGGLSVTTSTAGLTLNAAPAFTALTISADTSGITGA